MDRDDIVIETSTLRRGEKFAYNEEWLTAVRSPRPKRDENTARQIGWLIETEEKPDEPVLVNWALLVKSRKR